MAKTHTQFLCQNCGYKTPKWLGKCPECAQWNTLEEEVLDRKINLSRKKGDQSAEPKRIKDVEKAEYERMQTQISEFDRVVGGGLVHGSLSLISAQNLPLLKTNAF